MQIYLLNQILYKLKEYFSIETNGLYGGGTPSNNEDNSGVFEYVQIRHGGSEIGEGNEINGLTLGGVGSQTTIRNIEIIANLDDGLECFRWV